MRTQVNKISFYKFGLGQYAAWLKVVYVLSWFLCAGVHAAAALPRIVQGSPTAITSLDPFTIAGIDAYAITGNVIEPLARSNPRTGDMIPVLAKSWTYKNRILSIKLKEGVLFHDGGELTAEDVKFTYDAYFKPEYKAEIWRGMWDQVDSAKITGKYAIDFKLKEARYQTFEAILTSLRILPKSFYGKPDHDKFRSGICGTGPFKLLKFGRTLEFEPHLKHHGAHPPSFILIVKTVPDQKLATQMLKKNELDFYPSVTEGRPFRSGLGQGFWLDLNMSKPLFQKAEVRRALQMVWRRKTLNEKVYGGRMRSALDVFSPRTDFYPKGKSEEEDIPGARLLLKKNGWSDMDQDGVLENGKLKLEFTISINSTAQERWATLLQNDAREAGILVHIYRVEDDNQWLKRIQEGRYDAVARDGGLINEVTSLAWGSKAPYNYQKFSDPEIDRLTSELESEFDLKKRRLMMRKAVQRIRDLRPQVPGLLSEEEYFLVSERFEPDPENPTWAWTWKLR